MRRLIINSVAIVGAITMVGSGASAADDAIQSDVGFFVQTIEGKPAGCGIEFTIIFKDETNRHGALSGINGSITTFGTNDVFFTLLKFGAMDFIQPGNKPQLYKVNSASIYSPSLGSMNKYARFACEQAEGFAPDMTLPRASRSQTPR